MDHLHQYDYFDYLLQKNTNQKPAKFSILIDNNYLIQINDSDVINLFFDSNYQKKIKNPLKKQMATLFTCQNRGKLNIFISNQISREFTRIAPKKINLLRHYKKYFGIIGAKREQESFFIDCSTLLTRRANDFGFKADVPDTYSYLIASLANIEYFITEDVDLKGIFNYISKIRNEKVHKVKAEIELLVKRGENLYDIKQDTFPIRKILERLFDSYVLKPSLPIDIKDLSQELPEVTKKTDSLINVCNLLNEINDFIDPLNVKALEFREVIEKATDIIKEVSKKIGVNPPIINEIIDIQTLMPLLIERESLWEFPNNFEQTKGLLLNILDRIFEPHTPLEETFDKTISEIPVLVRCNCKKEFSGSIFYCGIGSSEESVENQLMHSWFNNIQCSNCNEEIDIKLLAWESPEGMLSYADFSDSECEVLNKKAIGSIIGITPE